MAIGDRAFSNCLHLRTVVIPESVTRIGEFAFVFDQVSSVTIPETVTYIGKWAFGSVQFLDVDGSTILDVNASNLRGHSYTGDNGRLVRQQTEFAVGGLMYEVTDSAGKAVRLTGYVDAPTGHLVVPSQVEFGGRWYNVTSAAPRVFDGCTGIGSVELHIDASKQMFYRCSGLASVDVCDGVTSIGASAFAYCDAISRLSLPSTLEALGTNAFYGFKFQDEAGGALQRSADSLRGGVYEGGGKVLKRMVPSVGDEVAAGGLLYRIVSDSPLEASLVGCESVPQRLVVPQSVRVYGLDVPVTSIGDSAFYGCSAIRSADLGSVSKVGVKAFVRCNGLSSVHAGDSLSTISAYAFFRCSNLSEFDLGGSLKTMRAIGSYAFQHDGKLSGIALPSFLSTVGGSAFSMSFIDEGGATLEATAESLRGYEYANIGGILVRQTGVEVGRELSWNGLTLTVTASLPAEAGISGYSGRPTLLVLSGPAEIEGTNYDITSVMANAFKGCRTLATADLAGVERLEAQAFYGCTKLASVFAPDLVTVGTKAFARCASLTDLDLRDGLTTIGAYGFWGCTSLESVELPDTVRSIGTYAFQRCSSLSSIGLGESLTVIGSYAFDGTAIASLEIPDSIVRLKEGALSGCSELREVVFEGGEKVILHAGVFEDTPNIERIAMPDGFRKIYAGALDGISFLDGDGNSIAATAKNLAGYTFVGEGGKLVLSA